jgi:HSP20 family protein
MKRRRKPMPETEQNTATMEIDDTIGRIETLYQTLTGRTAPPADPASGGMPPEKDPVQHIEDQLNRLLGLFGNFGQSVARAAAWMPPISVWESDQEVLVCLDVPGVRRDDVELVRQGRTLTVRGKRPAAVVDGGFQLRGNECATGPFARTVFVASSALASDPTAELKNGVLEIRIKKEPNATGGPKTVRVN